MKRIFPNGVFFTLIFVTTLFTASTNALTLEFPGDVSIPTNEQFALFKLHDKGEIEYRYKNDIFSIVNVTHKSGMGSLYIEASSQTESTDYIKRRKIPKAEPKGVYQIIILANNEMTDKQRRLFGAVDLKEEKPSGVEQYALTHDMTIDSRKIKAHLIDRDDLVFSDEIELPTNSRMIYFQSESSLFRERLTFADPLLARPLCQIGSAYAIALPSCDFIKAAIVSYTPKKDSDEPASITVFFQDTHKTAFHDKSYREIINFLSNDAKLGELITQILPQKITTWSAIARESVPPSLVTPASWLMKKAHHGQSAKVLPPHDTIPEKGIPTNTLVSEIKIMNQATKKEHQTLLNHKLPSQTIKLLNRLDKEFSTLDTISTASPAGCHIHGNLQNMLLEMFNGDMIPKNEKDIYGEPTAILTNNTVESIRYAVKAHVNMAFENGIEYPEVIIPSTANIAFDTLREEEPHVTFHIVPVDLTTAQPDLNAIRSLINQNTVLVVASAFNIPFGVTDPVQAFSDLALENERQFGIHVEASLGGFPLYWLKKLEYTNVPFAFDLPGVTSISAGLQSSALSFPGSTAVLFRHSFYSDYLNYTNTHWNTGPFYSHSPAGNQSIASHAMSWCSMLHYGKEKYKQLFSSIHEIASHMKKTINAHEAVEIIGDPSVCFAFRMKPDTRENNDFLDLVHAYLATRQINFRKQQNPKSLRFCVTIDETKLANFKEKFKIGFDQAIEFARKGNPQDPHKFSALPTTTLENFNSALTKAVFMKTMEYIRRTSPTLSLEALVESFKKQMRQNFNQKTGKLASPIGHLWRVLDSTEIEFMYNQH